MVTRGDAYGLPQCNVAGPYHLWHQRSGNPSRQVLNNLLQDFSILVAGSKNSIVCHSGYSNKIHKMPFSKSSLHNANQLNLLYIDFWGPSSVLLIDYKLYYILFVDQYSRYEVFHTKI